MQLFYIINTRSSGNTHNSGPKKDQKADKRTNGHLEPKNLLSPDQISSIFFPLKRHKFRSSPRCNLSNFKVLKIISHHWKWDIFKANIVVYKYIFIMHIYLVLVVQHQCLDTEWIQKLNKMDGSQEKKYICWAWYWSTSCNESGLRS